MVDPISFARNSRKIGPAQSRSQASSDIGGAGPSDGVPSAVEALIRKDLSKYSALQILQDEEGFGADRGWPPAQLKKLQHYLEQLEGLLLDTKA